MYHPCCPFCKSPKTIKHGGGRWICKRLKCGHTFTLKNKSVRNRAAITGYVLDRTTYERLGKRWNVHRSTAYRRVRSALIKRYSLLERTKRNISACDGICILDGKTIYIHRQIFTLFVAWDRGLKKPIHFLLKEGGEKELWYWRLLLDLKRVGYVAKAFVSDGAYSIKELLEGAYAGLPHQRCTVHVFLAARSKVTSAYGSTNERAQDFIALVRLILWSRTLAEAKRRLEKLVDMPQLKRGEYEALKMIYRALPQCFVCRDLKWRKLHLPRSSNAIENVMGQIEARLKTRRGTKSKNALELLTNEILLQASEQKITHN